MVVLLSASIQIVHSPLMGGAYGPPLLGLSLLGASRLARDRPFPRRVAALVPFAALGTHDEPFRRPTKDTYFSA